MRFLLYLVVIASALNPFIARTVETAQARLWCLSLRFQTGSDSVGDTLDLSTINGSANGELAPYNGRTYISGFSLDISGLPVTGTLYLDVPPVADLNGNGFNDFFESALDAGATTTGTYSTGMENGTVTATWQRPAGSRNGTCVLHLVDSVFGDLGQFRHVFQLIEYTGPIAFTPGSNTVTGKLNLVQTGDVTSQIQGPFQFLKVSTNRFNRLILQSGTWTNTAVQQLSFIDELFRRDPPWTTNYYGFVDLADGDPNTPEADYLTWILSIDDLNDANSNGIPDFSDDPATTTLPRAPQLDLVFGSTNLLLSVSGDVGHLHDIQQAPSLPSTNWQTIVSVNLTNNPQPVSIPYPGTTPVFWRALAH